MNVGKNNVDNDGLIQSRAGCSGSVSCAPSFIDLTSVQNYACWCFFGENYGKGRGPPKNVIDQICQKLQFCRRCIAVDSATDDESCNVAERGYKSPGFRDLIVGNIKSACDSVNKETCQYRSCTCELQFSQAIVQLFFSGYVYDPFFKHEKGYSWNENCPPYCTGGNCGGSRTELDCCGEYPERVPFNVKNRACCSKRKTYVMSKEVCCEDGSVVGFLESCPTGKTLENIIDEIEEEDRVLVAENTDSFSVPLEKQKPVDPGSRLVRVEDKHNLSSFTINSPCMIQTMDLAFIIDGSGSVGQENFDLMKEFVKNIISNLELGPNGVRIAMIQYATEVRTEFLYLDDKSDILFEIDAIDYMNGSTFTAKAILHYVNQVMLPFSRLYTPQRLVVISDGKTMDKLEDICDFVASSGVDMFAIGVGDEIGYNHLSTITRDKPSSIFQVNSHADLAEIEEKVFNELCSEAEDSEYSSTTAFSSMSVGNTAPTTSTAFSTGSFDFDDSPSTGAALADELAVREICTDVPIDVFFLIDGTDTGIDSQAKFESSLHFFERVTDLQE